ncbi:protein kinase domain-containing protein [Leucobacter sp. W1153]|uniref:protein kinase domain-containing protein n=1 Tax=Leucobacter sp. W1153 TaxID=3439064 RepID=UPI003F3BE5E5
MLAGIVTPLYGALLTEPNPRILANLKAKRLASVLKDLARVANAPAGTVPFVAEAIVLHGRGSRVRLDQFGAEAVWALDGFSVQGLGAGADFSALLARQPRELIDLQRARIIDALMNEAGLMPRVKQRMIGQYALDSGEPLGEGPGWQDFLVTHPRAQTKRRIRLFPYPKGASRDTRVDTDRRAEREFRLTDGIVHPGIIGPAELLSTEEGPALVFAFDAGEVSLAEYLARHADSLTFETRERIVQQLIELVRFAHGQRLTHRALSPLSVRVTVTQDGSPTLRIRDWDLARRPEAGTSTATVISRGLTDVSAHVEHEAMLYLAPETLRGSSSEFAQSLDVYGVGAVAFLVLTQHPPAANLAALESLIASPATGLDPRAVMPEISDAHAAVILEATAFQEPLRTIDIGSLQESFEAARHRDLQEEKAVPAQGDPLDAAIGEIVGERFEIEKRRGSGSTGVALQVTDYLNNYEHVILKLAKDDSAAARLAVEASVLDRLDHPRVVKRLDGPIEVGTRRGILMTDAGLETLSDRIRLEGKATIEQLERWAADLFEMAQHLEERGVFHRDIKPSNLAVKPDPSSRKPRLTLFDFSLAEEPLANIRSGSRPYLDPYLGSATRAQYDSAAERFAMAATLFELATSYPVWWPSGDTPGNTSEAPIVETSSFDPAVADGLSTFFRAALAPEVANRHPSLDAMRRAWGAAIAGASMGEDDAAASDATAQAATLETKLTDAGLSARALSALNRAQVTTVGELLGVPPMRINQIRGLGEQVRREIQSRIREWRERLTQVTTQVDSAPVPGRRAVESFVGTIAQKSGESNEARFKRVHKNRTLAGLLNDAARWVSDLGAIVTLDEIISKLLREYGSTLPEGQRWKAAEEVARTMLELDNRMPNPKFVFRAVSDRSRMVIAYSPGDGGGLSFEDAELHLEALLSLADIVDRLLANDEVIAAPRLRETLRASDTPALRLADSRVTQLAVGLSATGTLSSMGEAYRRDIAPARAVELALRGAATRELAVATIEQRVRARFPAVHEIPSRPGLDGPVRAAMPYLEWHSDQSKYMLRDRDQQSVTLTSSATTWGRSVEDPAIAARLTASLRDKAALALVVSRKAGLRGAAAQIAREHGFTVVDLADVALAALKSTAEAKRIDWQTVLRADGQSEASQDRRNLLQLARLAIAPAWESLLSTEEPIVFINAAVLARLGLVDLIAQVTDLATSRTAARWFLLPRPLSGGTPDLDGTPFPFGADGWLELSVDAFSQLQSPRATAHVSHHLSANTPRKVGTL